MAILARRNGPRRRMMADINVVPYIDVMLVLVVILMVSAPFVNPSLVDLPSLGRSTRAPDAPIEIIVKLDGTLLLRDRSPQATAGDVQGDLPQLVAMIGQRQKASPEVPVVISADKGVVYDNVTRVMDALYKANVRRVGLAVKPAT
jgi:biopolymer transport protein TolR